MVELEGEFAERVRASAQQLHEHGVSALGGLFDLTSQRLLRFALTITRHQQDAEDAVQAVLVRVGTEPERLQQVTAPWSYLLRMVRNSALEIARRQRRCQLLSDLSDLLMRRRVDEVELAETQRAVWTALRRLPAEQAEVIVLKIWEDLTFAQIAEIVDVSLHTAASRYQYGMKKLAGRLIHVRKDVYHE